MLLGEIDDDLPWISDGKCEIWCSAAKWINAEIWIRARMWIYTDIDKWIWSGNWIDTDIDKLISAGNVKKYDAGLQNE